MLKSLRTKKVILDTNVLVSILLAFRGSQSRLRKLFEYVLKNSHLYASLPTFEELNRTLLQDKFAKYFLGSSIQAFINQLKDEMIFVEPSARIDNCRDKDDNKFLELAFTVQADVIITGGNDLLVLNPFNSTHIISAAEAFNLIPTSTLDLRELKCPMNFVKSKIEIDAMNIGEVLEIILANDGEALESVTKSMQAEGHKILDSSVQGSVCILKVEKQVLE